MSRLATSFVLGYHGCDAQLGRRAVAGDVELVPSDQDYDWLGPGSYFWESDPQRALEWARSRGGRGGYVMPFVVGAVIDLGNCLDLVAREDQDILKQAYRSYRQMREQAGLPMPENRRTGEGDRDRRLRYLDCAVIRHLHSAIDDSGLEPYDTVRGMFTEGDALYAGSGFHGQSHVQIAVLTGNRIKGLFVPKPYPVLC